MLSPSAITFWLNLTYCLRSISPVFSLPYCDREVPDYCLLALHPGGVLHLCVYPAWLSYCLWGEKCSISVPRLVFLVASFQILRFFLINPSSVNRCLRTIYIFQCWEVEEWIAAFTHSLPFLKNGAELFSHTEPVLPHPSCAQARDRRRS